MSSSAKFGFISLVLYTINSIVGSGIFLLPQKAYLLMGPYSLLAILFIAVLVICLSCCFAEASGRFNENGGAFVYAKAAFGDFVGFEVGFMRYIVGIVSWSTLAVAFVTVTGTILPGLTAPYIQKIFIVIMILIFGVINYRGVRASELANTILTLFKLLPLGLFVFSGLFFIDIENFKPPESTSFYQDNFAITVILLFYAFGGFESIPVAAQDIKDPEKNMPRGILLGVITAMAFYVLIFVVTIGLSGKHIATSSAPIADAAKAIVGETGFIFVSITSLISILGINLAASFVAPRSLVALANHQIVPALFLRKNRYHVEGSAIVVTTALALVIALSGTFAELAILTVVARFAQYLPTCLAVLVFRRRFPGLASTYVIPGGSLIPLLSIATSLWLIANAPLNNLIFGFGGLVTGAIIYRISFSKNNRL